MVHFIVEAMGPVVCRELTTGRRKLHPCVLVAPGSILLGEVASFLLCSIRSRSWRSSLRSGHI